MNLNYKKYLNYENNLLLFGILLSLFFWISESALHTYLFKLESFKVAFLSPDIHELFMRLIIILLIATLSIYARRSVLIIKKEKIELEKVHTELKQIFDVAADGLWLIDKYFNVKRVNQYLANLTQIKSDNLGDKKCYEILHGSDCHTGKCPLKKIIDDNKDYVEYDIWKTRLDGTKIDCIISATPFLDKNGKTIGIIGTLRDITKVAE